MRSLRIACLVVGAILALVARAPVVSATSTPHPAHLTKDCTTYTGETPTYCSIVKSDLAAIPVGTKVWYKGPVLTNSYFLSSDVTLDTGQGDTATGYCIYETRSSMGLCTFWKGTGGLAGLTAVLDVTIDASGVWHWDGEYYFDDTAKAEPTAPMDMTHVLNSQDRRPW